jgi:hypothetical protein
MLYYIYTEDWCIFMRNTPEIIIGNLVTIETSAKDVTVKAYKLKQSLIILKGIFKPAIIAWIINRFPFLKLKEIFKFPIKKLSLRGTGIIQVCGDDLVMLKIILGGADKCKIRLKKIKNLKELIELLIAN